MGLDTVELVLEVERTFGITIPDADAEKITTVGALHRYVVAKLGLGDSSSTARSRCPSQAAFHRLRCALVEGLGVDRGSVRPATPMGSFVAFRGRREGWDRLAQALGIPLPGLAWPGWSRRAFALASLVGVPAILSVAAIGGVPAIDCAALVVALLCILAALAAVLSIPLATEIPQDCATVRDAVGVVLLGDPASIRDDLDPGLVWTFVRAILVDRFGIRPEEVTEGASFVGDLGLD